MKILISQSRQNVKSVLKSGKAVRIEFIASTGDGFARRLAEFLTKASNYCQGGSSRTLGFVDASSDEERAIKINIDGDGADFISDVKIVKEK